MAWTLSSEISTDIIINTFFIIFLGKHFFLTKLLAFSNNMSKEVSYG